MAEYLRLRQICLVAPHLEPVISDVSAIMGLDVCYRDGNVEWFGHVTRIQLADPPVGILLVLGLCTRFAALGRT